MNNRSSTATRLSQPLILVAACDDNFAAELLSGRESVSYITRHGETLATIAGLEATALASARLAEMTLGAKQPSLQELLAIQEAESKFFPVDSHTDCRDFYEFTHHRCQHSSSRQFSTPRHHGSSRGSRQLPSEMKILTPTKCMTADALIKTMVSPCLMPSLSTGIIQFWNCGNPLEMKRLPPPTASCDEDDLTVGDDSLRKGRSW